MSFLSVMQAFEKGIGRVLGFAPVIEGVTAAIYPAAVPFEQEAVAIIGVIEHSFAVLGQPNNGAAKAQAALPLITEALKASNLVAGRKIVDEAQFTKAAQLYVDATVALLNSIQHPEATSSVS